jgi:uncharacterized membrane protein
MMVAKSSKSIPQQKKFHTTPNMKICLLLWLVAAFFVVFFLKAFFLYLLNFTAWATESFQIRTGKSSKEHAQWPCRAHSSESLPV